MIAPTVGRQVWYYAAGKDAAKDQPQAATVVKVISNSSVCLAILDDCGQLLPQLKPTPVLLVQEGITPPEGGNYCCWMPYQLGQAKKTEAAEVKHQTKDPNTDITADKKATEKDHEKTTEKTEKNTVSIVHSKFEPHSTSVKVGETVKWTNDDTEPHTVTFSDDAKTPGSGQIQPGKTFELEVTTPGTYEYHCENHPRMKGTVLVS